jgi:NAD(P)-dependent dehydrogenase (short-subunit alcohol dehydrogenase family)
MPESEALFRLDGRVAVVIGGSGALGGAMAEALARAGARVVLAGRREAALADKQGHLSRLGLNVRAVPADAGDPDSLAELFTRVSQEWEPARILINAAGGNAPEATTSAGTPFPALDPEALRHVVDLNLFGGAVLPCQAFVRALGENPPPASIINVASMAGLRPLTRVGGYGAAKAAVANFTQWLAVHLARDLGLPVRVNALAPGFFLTEQNRYLLEGPDGRPTARGVTVVEHTPLGRFGRPQDLAGAAVWLASDASAFVTGAVVPVDGGFSAFGGV